MVSERKEVKSRTRFQLNWWGRFGTPECVALRP